MDVDPDFRFWYFELINPSSPNPKKKTKNKKTKTKSPICFILSIKDINIFF